MGNDSKDVCEYLASRHGIAESYVLVREMKFFLKTDSSFSPEVGVKIWKSLVLRDNPYHFNTSHHVHTPTQADAYYPSRTMAESEFAAIDQAISSLKTFVNGAIRAGHKPSEDWLVPNEDY